MANFWASARQIDVFPVPGGPWRSNTLFKEMMVGLTCCREK